MSVYSRKWTVRFADTDPFGIAHYPRIIEALHETADEYMESIGHPFWEIQESFGVGLPIVTVEANFTAMLEAGDVVTIELDPDLGDSSVRFDYVGTVNGKQHFDGYEQRVCVATESKGSISLPEPLRKAMTGSS